MAVALAPYAHNDLFAPTSTGIDFPWPLCAKTTYEKPDHVPPIPTISDNDSEELDFNRKERDFEIAYHALADRRGANATPAGRAASRKIWRDAGTKAVEWLIDKFKKEQHPETIIGIAETITALEDIALPVVLTELEGDEPKPEYAALVEALAWMKPPQQFYSLLRVVSIINRYLASPHLDCQVAAVQLTRILDDDQARQFLDRAKKSAKQRLHEEIEDLLNERFEE